MKLRDLVFHFSLPTQRCFQGRRMERMRQTLFSAYAEVFPSVSDYFHLNLSFLCLRRGVSSTLRFQIRPPLLFSAYAEVFPLMLLRRPRKPPFLCLRRGVSGCRESRRRREALFSAYAEVFLKGISNTSGGVSFLCLRRGVSHSGETRSWRICFSLPTQRCFQRN